jgi:hypothetical protein
MQLSPYVGRVAAALESAAVLGDEHTRTVARSLAGAADPAVRLALVAAVSAAADEITAALLDAPGAPSVSARLTGEAGSDGLGSELRIEVRTSEPDADEPTPLAEDADASARISLRLPETLKADIDAAARRESMSVNTWLVRAAAAGLRSGTRPGRTVRTGGSAAHITGWINP